jgi:outer membrane protein TolC
MNIKNAFYAVLYTKEMLEIVNVSFENAQANLNNVTALSREGMVSEFTLLDAQVRVENIKPTIKQLENAVASATDGLKILMNIPQTENINVAGNITYSEENLQDIDRIINQARNNNLNILTLEQAIKLTQANVAVSESDYYPTVAAFANYGYNAMSNTFSNWATYPTSMVGLSFSMNLFRGFQTKYKTQQSKIEVIKAEEQIGFLKDAIAMQVRTNVNELLRIQEDIEAQRRNVTVAERAYHLSTVRFQEGMGSQLEILNSDVALRQAKTNLLESEYNYVISRAKLDNLLGQR